MCGKAAVSYLIWAEVYTYTSSFTSPVALPVDLESRINISPCCLHRKSEPSSMVRETLLVTYRSEYHDSPAEAIWYLIPVYSECHLPTNKKGQPVSTLNRTVVLNFINYSSCNRPKTAKSLSILSSHQLGTDVSAVMSRPSSLFLTL